MMQAAWGPDTVSFSGRFYSIPESESGPEPVQGGGPQIILVAVKGAAVERAGRMGSELNPLPLGWEMPEGTLQTFQEAARAAGHDPWGLPIVVRVNTAVGARYAPEGERSAVAARRWSRTSGPLPSRAPGVEYRNCPTAGSGLKGLPEILDTRGRSAYPGASASIRRRKSPSRTSARSGIIDVLITL